MSSFSHLSASHNSNNGNPKKHWRAPAWCDSAIWDGARPFCRDHARAHPPPAGTARKLVLRQGTKSWPARPVVGNLSFGASEESIRALFETHGTVSLPLVPAQAPCLQRVRSPEVAFWEIAPDSVRQNPLPAFIQATRQLARKGLTIFRPAKCLSFSVTTTQSFASAIAAT